MWLKRLFKNKDVAEQVEAEAKPVKIYINDNISINFSMLKVFSIERIKEQTHPTTVIGYYDSVGKCSEWYLAHISNARHIKLVEEFNNHIATKPSSENIEINKCEFD